MCQLALFLFKPKIMYKNTRPTIIKGKILIISFRINYELNTSTAFLSLSSIFFPIPAPIIAPQSAPKGPIAAAHIIPNTVVPNCARGAPVSAYTSYLV